MFFLSIWKCLCILAATGQLYKRVCRLVGLWVWFSFSSFIGGSGSLWGTNLTCSGREEEKEIKVCVNISLVINERKKKKIKYFILNLFSSSFHALPQFFKTLMFHLFSYISILFIFFQEISILENAAKSLETFIEHLDFIFLHQHYDRMILYLRESPNKIFTVFLKVCCMMHELQDNQFVQDFMAYASLSYRIFDFYQIHGL